MSSIDLRGGGLRSRKKGEEADPMASVGNLADVMLVFACGLMMALITYWNVDISAVTEVLQSDEVQQIDNPEDITDQLKSTDGTSYINMGNVYMDPATGKYYMVTEGDGSTEATAGTATTGAATGTGDATTTDAATTTTETTTGTGN